MQLLIRLGAAMLVLCTSAGAQSPAADLDDLLATEVSSASRIARTSRRAAGSVTVITAEQIDRFGYRTLAEALASVPGLYVTYDRNYSYVGVRGYSRPTDYNNRVLVLVDGYRLNEDVYGYAPVGSDLPVDLHAVERIEVVRGPGSAAFGTAAMLAVINVVLRDPSQVGGVEAALEGGSHARAAAAVQGGGESASGLGGTWAVSGEDSEGESSTLPAVAVGEAGATVRGADRDSGWKAHGKLRYGALRLTALAGEREKGFSTGAWGTVVGDLDAQTVDRFRLLGASWDRDLGRGVSVLARGNVGHYSYDGVYPGPDGDFLDSTDNQWLGGGVQMRWEESSSHELIVGAEYRDNLRADYRSFDREGALFYEGDHPFRVVSLFFEDELQIGEDLVLTSGVRFDRGEQTETTSSPRFALVWLPDSETTLKVLYGRAFRSPNLYEMWYQDGISGGFKANPRLASEKVETVEIAATRRVGEGSFAGASLYSSWFDDLIEQQLDPADGLWQFENAAHARSLGGELEWTASLRNGASAYASVGIQRTVDQGDDRLTNSPARLVKIGVSAPLAPRWRFAGELRHESSRGTVHGTSTDDFLLANALVQWKATERLGLEIQVRNLFDREYGLPGGWEHAQPAIEQEGRTVTLRAEASF